jgi:putative copper export protein/methionine-rich copper-binding protein CopC
VVAVSAFDPSRPTSRAHLAPGHAKRALTLLVLSGLAGVVALLGPSSVAAQDANTLQSIQPENGQNLETSPETIVLSFNQEIRSDDRPVLQLQCNALPQDVSSPDVDADGLVVTWTVNTPVPKGSCTISWRLTDADGNTIAGPEFSTFRVDSEPTTEPTTAATVAGAAPATTNPFLEVTVPTGAATTSSDAPNQGSSGGALWLGRLLSTLGILALFGGLALIALGWPEGPEYVVTVRYLRAVWVIAMIGTLLYLIAFAARSGDISFASAMSPGAWLDLADAGWPGRGALLRLALVAGCGWVAMRPERIIDPTTAMWAWGLPGAALVAVALSRVDGPMAWFGVLVGLGHLISSALWFGGVALVARVVLAGPGEEDLVHATRSFSRISTKAMFGVVITGIIQMVRLVGNPFESSHGRVLLLKVVAVAAMVAVALAARQQVGYRLDRAHEMTVPLADRFRRAFGAEAAIGVVVLAFSGWMLALTPAKVDPLAGQSYTRELAFVDSNTGINARVLIGPARVGRNGFRIEVESPPDGITGLTLRFVPPAGSNEGAIKQEIALTTAGTLVLPQDKGLPFDVPGTWTLVLSATTAVGTQPGASTTFLVENGDGSQPSVPGAPVGSTVPGASVVVSVVGQTNAPAPFVTTAPPTPPPGTTGG